MDAPPPRALEDIERHLPGLLASRLGRAIVGDVIADQLLSPEAMPLPENVDELREAVEAAMAAPDLSDAVIRNIFFLALSPVKPRANVRHGRAVGTHQMQHGAAPPLEPDTPIFSNAELQNDNLLLSFPQLPYYKEIIKVLRMWLSQGRFPIEFVPLGGLFETSNEPQRMNLQTPEVQRIAAAWPSASDVDRTELCIDLLKLLGVRGILTMLRVRRTAGTTMATMPPPLQRLVWAFNSTGKGRATLTEGARAVSKHFHRDETNKFWGDNKGSDAHKNQHANEILRRIVRASVWINVHQLPHDVTICEVRTPEGYGARWSGDGSMFRGFLEPHVEDGHEKGWKH